MVIKIYFSGKISNNSLSKKNKWRDDIYLELAEELGRDILKLDPLKRDCDEGDSKYIVGQNSSYIKSADFVLILLTDNISFGASAEVLIAKYFKIPVIGIAKEGKFVKSKTRRNGKNLTNWVHPYVDIFCDFIVPGIKEVAKCIKEYDNNPRGLSVINDCIKHYSA